MDLVQALRSDQAGETGAVWIYRAMRLFRHDSATVDLIQEHLAQESQHLDEVNAILPRSKHSLLVPLWAVAGFVTGLVPAVMGPNWIKHTIVTVETFVDQHYLEQIEFLSVYDADLAGITVNNQQQLIDILKKLRFDEIRHRQDALGDVIITPSRSLKLWCKLVDTGSKAAVKIAMKF